MLTIAAVAALQLVNVASSVAATPPFTKQCAPWLCNALISIDRYGNARVDIDWNLYVYPPDAPLDTPPALIGVQNDSRSTVYDLHLETSDPVSWAPCGWPPASRPPQNEPNIKIVNIATGVAQFAPPPYYAYWAPQPSHGYWWIRCDVVISGGIPKGGSTYFTIGGFHWGLLATVKNVVPFISVPSGIVKGQTAMATVTLNPSPSPVSVTLDLTTTSGTGSAVFTATNSARMTITQTTSVEIKAVDASSARNNIQLSASAEGEKRGFANFSVVWVDLALRSAAGTTVSTDNAKLSNYEGKFGHTNLGAFSDLGDFGCKTGVELVGTVHPSDYPGLVVLRRKLLNYGVWDGSELLSTVGPNPVVTATDDTSDESFRDDDPQSGNSGGKVYDLDAPGANDVELDHTYRVRQNFSSYAVLDDAVNTTPASDLLAWYSAVSCTLTSTGPVLNSDVANDNQANSGAIPLSWNLF